MRGVSSLILFIAIVASLSFGQSTHPPYNPRAERGDNTLRRKTTVGANNVRTTEFNFGFSGRTGGVADEIPFEWPKGTRQNYFALVATCIGGLVANGKGDSIHIVDFPNYRQSPLGKSWNLEPVAGYFNTNGIGIARSDDPATWPSFWPDAMADTTDPGWPGVWNGLLGKNKFIDGVELYYHTTDNMYDRFSYTPDSTDTSRHGLGIVQSRRILQFNHPLFRDAVVYVDDIYNGGAKTISDVALTYWIADLVGGDGDSQDDHAFYNADHSGMYFVDNDGRGNSAFGTEVVGSPAFVILNAPGGNKMVRTQYTAAGGINFNTKTDEAFWNDYMRPSNSAAENYDDQLRVVGDYDAFLTPGHCSLAPGESQRFVASAVFGNDTNMTRQRVEYMRTFVNNGFQISNASVSLSSPMPDSTYSGTIPVSWNTTPADSSMFVDIYYSKDLGLHWNLFAFNQPNTGYFSFNSDIVQDGVFNLIQIVLHDSSRLGFTQIEAPFRINNSRVAPPQFKFEEVEDDPLESGTMNVGYTAGDADTSGIMLMVTAQAQTELDTLFSGWIQNGRGNKVLDISRLPNAENYTIKAIAIKGDTSSIDALPVSIRNPRTVVIQDTLHLVRRTVGTGAIEVHVVDSTKLTGHRYQVVFYKLGSDTVYDVTDLNSGNNRLVGISSKNRFESPQFDGIRLYMLRDTLDSRTRTLEWNSDSVMGVIMNVFRQGSLRGMQPASDYMLTIGPVGIDTCLSLKVGVTTIPAKPVNFVVRNRTTNQKVFAAFWEFDGTDGRLSGNKNEQDWIILLEPNQDDSLVITWRLSLLYDELKRFPQEGDTLIIRMKKPFLPGDTYTFTAMTPSGTLDAPNPIVPAEFALRQNYPNPFNPLTRIAFSTAGHGMVHLDIFNVLGQRVRGLVSADLDRGEHSVVWDGRDERGRDVASGVYFYRLSAGSSVLTRRMIMLR